MVEETDVGKDAEKISRNYKLLVGLLKQVFMRLIKSYKEYFMLEEFLRMMHDAKDA
jgi:hypothetical protein